MSMQSFESPGKVAVPPEYMAQLDYERQLREPRRTFCDFAEPTAPPAGGESEDKKAAAPAKAPGVGIEVRTEPSARRIRISWSIRTTGGGKKRGRVFE